MLKIKYSNEFSLSDVTLPQERFKYARDPNIYTLLEYNVDRLLAPCRKKVVLKPKNSSYKIGKASIKTDDTKHDQ